jgi:hypothetical protein
VDFNANELIEMEGLISVGLCTFFCQLHGNLDLVAQNFPVGGLEFSCRRNTDKENVVPTEKFVARQ